MEIYEINEIEEKNGVEERKILNSSTNVIKKNTKEQTDDYFTVHIYKKCQFQVCKPLLPIQLIFFLWHGGGAFSGLFLTLYMKQRGITLTELSTLLFLLPFVGILLGTLSGILADKLGKLKLILFMSILIVVLSEGGLLLVLQLNDFHCHSETVSLKCDPQQLDRRILKTACDIVEDTIEINSCHVQCPENTTGHCVENNLIREIFAGKEDMTRFTLSIDAGNGTSTKDNRCLYNVSSISYKSSWCNASQKMHCIVTCTIESGVKCATNGNRTLLVVAITVIFVFLRSVLLNCYRLLDTVAMSIVTKHGGDYGQSRLFGCLGAVVLSPMAGLCASSTSYTNSEKNYLSALYCYMVLIVVVLFVVSKLDVPEYKPGKKMVKKTSQLLRNPDIVVFILVIFILGTASNFAEDFLFWYLEEMKASSLLMGLVPAAESIYGLPFLATSGWYLKKMGPNNIFIVAFLAYVVYCTSYSFLKDPWYALIIESAKIFNYHLLWVSVVVQSHSIAPDGLKATVIGTAGVVHYQIGKLSASAIGGVVMNSFGGHIAFRFLAVVCAVSALIYALFLHIRRTCFTIK